MSGRLIFTGNDAELVRARHNFAFFFLLCALGLCAVAACSFVAGMEWANALHKEAARVEAQKPKRAQPATFTPLLGCKTNDLIEYQRICAARRRMSAVGVQP